MNCLKFEGLISELGNHGQLILQVIAILKTSLV